MKKVSGYVSVRALGCYDFEFYVDDNVTEEEIQKKVDEHMQLSHHYDVEEGYEEYTETKYRKGNTSFSNPYDDSNWDGE